jgi:hypothetical protein
MDHAVKGDSGDPTEEPREGNALAQREIRICSVCGTKFSVITESECCPVCVLRGASGGEGEATGTLDSASESETNEPKHPTVAARFENYEVVKGEDGKPVQRFEHYELVKGEDGKPVELGRGAMGVT